MQIQSSKQFYRGGSALLLTAVMGLAWQGVATAQVYQPYWNARAVSDDSPALGGVVGFGDNMFRLAGHARFNMTSMSDLGLELVFDNIEDDIGDDNQFFGGGLDYKYTVVGEGERLPFDLAAQACAGMQWGDDVRTLTVPVGMLGSKAIAVDEGGRVITPYLGFYFIIDHVTVDVPGGGESSDTDVDAEIRFGSAFQIVGNTHAYAGLNFGAGTMFFLGFTAGL
jgi:hypothetical protein